MNSTKSIFDLNKQEVAKVKASFSNDQLLEIRKDAEKEALKSPKIREDYTAKLSYELLRKPFEKVK